MIKRHYEFDNKKWFKPLYIHEDNDFENNRAYINLKYTNKERYFVRIKIFHQFKDIDFDLSTIPDLSNGSYKDGNSITIESKDKRKLLQTDKSRSNQHVIEFYLFLEKLPETRHFTIRLKSKNSVRCYFTVPACEEIKKQIDEKDVLGVSHNLHQQLKDYNSTQIQNHDLFFEGDPEHEHTYHHIQLLNNNRARLRICIFHTFNELEYEQPFFPINPIEEIKYDDPVFSKFIPTRRNSDQQLAFFNFKVQNLSSQIFGFKLDNGGIESHPRDQSNRARFITEHCDIIIPKLI